MPFLESKLKLGVKVLAWATTVWLQLAPTQNSLGWKGLQGASSPKCEVPGDGQSDAQSSGLALSLQELEADRSIFEAE